jgi:hypothetical protein
MSQFDLHNYVKTYPALTIQTINSNTATNGAIIDTQYFESLELVILSGTITDGTYVPSIYESDDSGMAGATAITSDFLIGTTNVVEPTPSYGTTVVDPIGDATFTGADDNKTARIGVLNKKRYVRLTLTSTVVTTGGVLSAVAVLSHPHHVSTAKDK